MAADVPPKVGHIFIPAHQLRVKQNLGEGAFAVVDKAYWRRALSDTDDDAGTLQPVAVKRLKTLHCSGSLRDFMREATLMTAIRHEHICRCHGIGSSNSNALRDIDTGQHEVYMVLDFCQLGSLRSLLLRQMTTQQRLYHFADALRWARQLASALAHLHALTPRVVHRDVKAANVLLSGRSISESNVHLCDFGLHVLLQPHEDSKLPAAPKRTLFATVSAPPAAPLSSECNADWLTAADKRSEDIQPAEPAQRLWDSLSVHSRRSIDICKDTGPLYCMTGMTGSCCYMPPEVTLERPYNENADTFSFGVLLYELMTRAQLAITISETGTEEEAQAFAQRVADGHRQAIPDYVPERLAAVITACWAQSPAARPGMAAVAAELAALAESGEVELLDSGAACCMPGMCAVM